MVYPPPALDEGAYAWPTSYGRCEDDPWTCEVLAALQLLSIAGGTEPGRIRPPAYWLALLSGDRWIACAWPVEGLSARALAVNSAGELYATRRDSWPPGTVPDPDAAVWVPYSLPPFRQVN
jgi:hypothetical protein